MSHALERGRELLDAAWPRTGDVDAAEAALLEARRGARRRRTWSPATAKRGIDHLRLGADPAERPGFRDFFIVPARALDEAAAAEEGDA